MSTIPLPGETFTFSIPLVSQSDSHVFQVAPTVAAGDFKRAINNGSFANMDNLPVVAPTGGRLLQIVVSADETTAAGAGGTIDIVGSDASGAEWDDIHIALRVGVIAANAAQISGDSSAADNAESFFDGTGYAGTNNTIPTVTTLTNMPAAAPSAADVADAVLDEILSAHDIEDSLGNVLNDLTAETGGVYAFTAAALALAPGGGGTLYSYSNTVDDGSGNLLDGVFIQCATDAGFTNIVMTTSTNALGAFTVRNDTSGTHYLRLQLAGYSFADQTVTLA